VEPSANSLAATSDVKVTKIAKARLKRINTFNPIFFLLKNFITITTCVMIIKCEEDEETNEYFAFIYSMENAKIWRWWH